MLTKRKLRKTTFKSIESDWFHFYENKSMMVNIREEILHPYDPYPLNTAPGKNSVRWPGDPVGSKAIKLSAHSTLLYLTKHVYAVRTVYESSSEEYRKLAQLRYWKKKDWDYIESEMHVSKRQLMRYRNDIICRTAELLGAV